MTKRDILDMLADFYGLTGRQKGLGEILCYWSVNALLCLCAAYFFWAISITAFSDEMIGKTIYQYFRVLFVFVLALMAFTGKDRGKSWYFDMIPAAIAALLALWGDVLAGLLLPAIFLASPRYY